jgi:transaldolase
VTRPLQRISELGQAVWLDEISRDMTRNGELQRMIEEESLVGVTSNPAIFQKAIANSERYDEQLEELYEKTDDSNEIFLQLARVDIQEACDIMAPVHKRTGGQDGYVSLEVSPDLAYDTRATIEETERLFEMVDRPNLLVKVPATLQGLVAIEEMISRGCSINVTLCFSLERYREVARAYVRGIQRLVEGGGDPSGVRSVASFFVSRIDTEADERLEELGAPDELKGKLAIANAKLAYQIYGEVFSGSRWQSLGEKGANKQRLLWASTSTKTPDFPDTLYVENLIGPETVDTMPRSTLKAFQEHGEARPTLEEGVEDAKQTFKRLREAGLDYEAVTDALEQQGIQKFVDPFEKTLEEVEKKGRRLACQ